MPSKKPLWVLSVLYSAFLLFLAYGTIPITEALKSWGIYALCYWIIFALALFVVGVALWRGRKAITPLRWVGFLIIFMLYWVQYEMLRYSAERVHLITYSLLGILYLNLCRHYFPYKQSLITAFVTASIIGFLDEILQHFIPDRFFEWGDVYVNSAACCLALAGYTLLQKRAIGSDP